uniref:Uncharacterized protein n=1 Tax=Ditylenchus dipsaci TaxID=166011 RepID=A0A915EJD5_9BILA
MFKAGNYTPSAVTYVFYKTTLLDIMPDIIPESKKDKDPGVIKYVSKHQTSITTQEQAEWVLENALKKLEQQQVPSEHAIIDSFWIDACHKSGFELHWAVDKSLGVDPAGVIYMKKWLDTKHPDSLPLAAFTTVGVGAVVMNELNEYC